ISRRQGNETDSEGDEMRFVRGTNHRAVLPARLPARRPGASKFERSGCVCKVVEEMNRTKCCHDRLFQTTRRRTDAVLSQLRARGLAARTVRRRDSPNGVSKRMASIRRDADTDVLQRAQKAFLPAVAHVGGLAAISYLRRIVHRGAVWRSYQLQNSDRLV